MSILIASIIAPVIAAILASLFMVAMTGMFRPVLPGIGLDMRRRRRPHELHGRDSGGEQQHEI